MFCIIIIVNLVTPSLSFYMNVLNIAGAARMSSKSSYWSKFMMNALPPFMLLHVLR